MITGRRRRVLDVDVHEIGLAGFGGTAVVAALAEDARRE
jgi:hypothetical protein